MGSRMCKHTDFASAAEDYDGLILENSSNHTVMQQWVFLIRTRRVRIMFHKIPPCCGFSRKDKKALPGHQDKEGPSCHYTYSQLRPSMQSLLGGLPRLSFGTVQRAIAVLCRPLTRTCLFNPLASFDISGHRRISAQEPHLTKAIVGAKYNC